MKPSCVGQCLVLKALPSRSHGGLGTTPILPSPACRCMKAASPRWQLFPCCSRAAGSATCVKSAWAEASKRRLSKVRQGYSARTAKAVMQAQALEWQRACLCKALCTTGVGGWGQARRKTGWRPKPMKQEGYLASLLAC